MTSKNKQPAEGGAAASSGMTLRQRADAAYSANPSQFQKASTSHSSVKSTTNTPEDSLQLLHELQVHQIELEMQNQELREAQAELNDALARYFDLYDLAPVGYCTINAQGLILQANLTAASLLSMARSALVKQPLSRFILDADRNIYDFSRKQLVNNGDPLFCELRMLKGDGTQFWAHLTINAANDADAGAELRVVLSDISARKLAEEDLTTAHQRAATERILFNQVLSNKNAELELAVKVAEKANLAKSEFLSSMSHELRTPLNAILGFTQLIESGSPPPSPSQQRSLEQILKGGWYLLELINEILDLALIESGKLSLSMEAVSLAEVLLECENIVGPLAEKYGIRLAFQTIEHPYFLKANHTRVKQILLNLLSNAIKYNRVGGTVTVDCILKAPESIRISVQDTGQGLAPEQITQLFQPFNRLEQEAIVEEGTGIGLVVSKRLVEYMGGRIGVESTVGTGSVFWFELELTDAPLPGAYSAECRDTEAGSPAISLNLSRSKS